MWITAYDCEHLNQVVHIGLAIFSELGMRPLMERVLSRRERLEA